MTYNLTGLTSATSYPGMILGLDSSLGNMFVMGVLITINIILFLMIYRTSGLKGAFTGSVFPIAFLSALLYPLNLVTQYFFIFYLCLGIVSLVALWLNR